MQHLSEIVEEARKKKVRSALQSLTVRTPTRWQPSMQLIRKVW